jgi:translation initiation factor IF-1
MLRAYPSYTHTHTHTHTDGLRRDLLRQVFFHYKRSVCQSVPHRKHPVSTTETNRLMLFGEAVAVYCENHTEHINTLCGQDKETIYKNPVYTSQGTHYVSATETNRLMLFGETVAVYCENHKEHINTLCG